MQISHRCKWDVPGEIKPVAMFLAYLSSIAYGHK